MISTRLIVTDPTIIRIIDFLRTQDTPTWAVGGFVRDRLLEQAGGDSGRMRPQSGKPRDLDIVVSEGGIRLARAVARRFGGSFFVLDQERDVARAVLRDEAGQPLNVDVARLRAGDLLEDLAFRDFTVNAIAADLGTSEGDLPLIDPYNGRADIVRRLLRAVTEGAFVDDPLRMLRAVRQAAELGLRIENATYGFIRRDAALLAHVAVERVSDEMMRVVTTPGAWRHLSLLEALGLLAPVLPELAGLRGVNQTAPHYLDAFDHTRAVLAHLEGVLALLWPESGYARPSCVMGDLVLIAGAAGWGRLAQALLPYADALRSHHMRPLASGHTRRSWLFWCALAHDWGKAVTASVAEDGRIHFYGHDERGAVLAEERARALAFSAAEATYLSRMVGQHMRLAFLARDYPPTRRALYHYLRDLGDIAPDCILLGLADRMATRGVGDQAGLASGDDPWGRDLDTATLLLGSFFGGRDVAPHDAGCRPQVELNSVPFFDGRQIMAEFGLVPGPLIGSLLEGLREVQAVGEVTTLDQARAWLADRIIQDRKSD
jgi:tRNA nucleotidyltransferase/poly(A) polymerase